MQQTIDLSRFRKPQTARIFAGRPRGEAVRDDVHLAQLIADDQVEEINVIVPVDIFQITSSFFLGMFGDAIRALGADAFRRRFRFQGKDIQDVIEEGIADALNFSSALQANGRL